MNTWLQFHHSQSTWTILNNKIDQLPQNILRIKLMGPYKKTIKIIWFFFFQSIHMSKYPRVIILVTFICKPYTRLPIENNKNNNKFWYIANIDFCFGICDMKKLVNVSSKNISWSYSSNKIKFPKFWSKKNH